MSTPVDIRTAEPAPASELLLYYRSAQRTLGVPWHVLAAVNFVESRFGRILGPSSAGALGPMQFLRSTWAAYGRGGDILDPRDAIFAAARLLRAAGAPGDLRSALYAYNHSNVYVDSIITYARQMKRDIRTYYAYHSWEVFVLTDRGDLQLTGPGSNPSGG